jgi:ABC-2 type transport system ATP-binding protein
MTQALSIQNLSKVYKNGVIALHGIDLNVEQGDFFALLGPNGAGKSTTIHISSLVNKSAGTVRVFGHDLDTDLAAAKACIGLVPQEFNFSMFEPVEEVLLNQDGYYGIPPRLAAERAEFYLHKLGLWDKRKGQGRALSGGMKRRLMIARALVHEPRLLILDEPTAGVDIEIRYSCGIFAGDQCGGHDDYSPTIWKRRSSYAAISRLSITGASWKTPACASCSAAWIAIRWCWIWHSRWLHCRG